MRGLMTTKERIDALEALVYEALMDKGEELGGIWCDWAKEMLGITE